MCGIVGVVGSLPAGEGAAVVERMNGTLGHRGPDDKGAWATDGVAFAMRRLSIIDLAGGHQPMWSGDGEGKGVGIVFNGEIYNYRALRQELARKGEAFHTRSDTEVILRLYKSVGLEGLARLEGMFAICLFDPAASVIHLIRDRLGIKPLYYAEQKGRFYFASEIKALLAGMKAKPSVDRDAIHHYLTLRYVPAPGSIWKGIRKLEPGYRLTYRIATGQWEKTRYWHVAFESRPLEAGRDYCKEFERLFLDAVEKRLVAADVPVGVMLSGGLDSSAISAAAVELGHRNFHTFSVGFEDGDTYSELHHARAVSEHIGSRHHELVIDRWKFLDFLPEFVRYSDEPLADLASVPLYYLSRLARDDVKVVLSGEGSDEILAGYDLEKLVARLDTLKHWSDRVPKTLLQLMGRVVPGSPGRALRDLSKEGWPRFLRTRAAHMTRHWDEDEKRALWKTGDDRPDTDELIRSWYDLSPSSHPLDQLQQVYCHSWLVEDLLMKADKMSMAASLELRVPFLDHKLVEWAARLPVEWKVGSLSAGYVSKRILRDFARSRLPQSIIERPKQGFPVPAYGWLQGELGGWAEDRLRKGGRLDALFDPAAMVPVLNAARAGDTLAAHKVWVLLILDHWLEQWA